MDRPILSQQRGLKTSSVFYDYRASDSTRADVSTNAKEHGGALVCKHSLQLSDWLQPPPQHTEVIRSSYLCLSS